MSPSSTLVPGLLGRNAVLKLALLLVWLCMAASGQVRFVSAEILAESTAITCFGQASVFKLASQVALVVCLSGNSPSRLAPAGSC